MKVVDAVRDDLVNDVNWNRAAELSVKGARALPSASGQYFLDKFPIIGWLPRYNPRWLVNDVIAGVTVGLMLIPQGLSYAKIATIPVQYGLMSSWFPAIVYAFMGTTKDLSTGPTSLIGLLTSDIVAELQDEYSPSEIASAVALMMGVYGMILGFLKLGFLLEFISLPILSGFISAVAITIILNQMDSLLGESNVGDGVATQIHDIFNELPNANGYACAIGFTGIFLLTVLDQAGKRWGKKNKIVWFLSITRAFMALIIFTGIGYAVNKNLGEDDYLFEVAQVKSEGQETPRLPNKNLIALVASRSIAVFIGSAVEHTAIARGFGVRNNYVTDQSQELCYYGLTNFFNSFFHAMGVGGAMSRTAVNSSCNVKSPLSGFLTTAIVLLALYPLAGALYWIPKPTLAAIIITAVWPLISSPSVFYTYWKASLADFISSQLALWISLFVSTEIGIATAVGFNIVYTVLRQVFARPTTLDTSSTSSSSFSPNTPLPPIPQDTRVFRFTDSLYFPNAYAVKQSISDAVATHHAPAALGSAGPEVERNWSVVAEKRVARLRRAAGIASLDSLPPVRVVVLDFTRANHVDYTAVQHLRDLRRELRAYGGQDVDLRFAGVERYVRERLVRGGWKLVDAEEGAEGGALAEDVTRVFATVGHALEAPRLREGSDEEELEKKARVSHQEIV